MDKTSTQKKFITPVNTKKNEMFDNELSLKPSDGIINNIINYSKALTIKESKSMEYFEMVLN